MACPEAVDTGSRARLTQETGQGVAVDTASTPQLAELGRTEDQPLH